MEGPSLQYFTVVYGVLHLATREVRFASAAHPGPVYLPRDGAEQVLTQPAFAIGWEAATTYDEVRLRLSPGDRLVIFSDGLIEAMRAGEQFGSARFAQELHAKVGMPLDDCLASVVRTVRDFSGERFVDDVSILALEVGALEVGV
jgi:phosphoserine phosphatase RsbU/P